MTEIIGTIEKLEPAAWRFDIEPYADHVAAAGVVLSKSDVSPSVPADKIRWTPLYAGMARGYGEYRYWCHHCGCGNDALGFAHASGCRGPK